MAAPIAPAAPLIAAEGIAHAFGTTRVLDGVDVAIGAGERVAIIGPNGAGKTTLLRILAGLLPADAGSVRLGGNALDGLERREIARRVAVVPQARPQLFDFSALEVVLMGFHARSGRLSLPSADQRDRALAAMARLEIDRLADRPASVLSGGELQRVLMARTMVAGAGVWLLDEPTASLDLRHQVALLAQVRRHVADGGAAVAVLHDLALVHRDFDRVLVLDQARLVADGPPDTTLTEPLVSRVFDVPLVRGEVGDRVVWVVASP